jgi:hypothetical protein
MIHKNINDKDLDNYLISLGIKEQLLKDEMKTIKCTK